MKHLVVASLATLMLVFTGCSQKSPQVDMTQSTTTPSSVDSKMDNISGVDATKVETGAEAVAKLIADLEQKAGKVYFDFDKYTIRSDMQQVIEANAALFKQVNAAGLSIKVEGNCDEWGTDEYNYALGLKRAKAVKDALVAQGVSSERVMVVSFGESNPVCTQSNKQCWDQNRRAEFKLLP
ncbi:peptidoglycan-associated lipoprotein Pal [Sulfurospirillum sp. T05]|uniref:Peptidoglycan-associated lipoprotein n=1 Tax=Sulfurospirillum tamanense TaxID=2813362 RepID=A0ABS2WPR4_9BACT|nr:peptidoglycan-associated lipoprotein Pal [Sulfurospirillum tamanensis]MBN2963686.1 peptidoglycan-associated lipoprotein Pal [Sulfurospirillum tamanensis]